MNGLRAVELQLTDRLEHDISKVLPTLHGIVTYLKDPHSRTHVMLNAAHMSEFREVISEIALQLPDSDAFCHVSKIGEI